MKYKKLIHLVFLPLALAFFMSACGGSDSSNQTQVTDTELVEPDIEPKAESQVLIQKCSTIVDNAFTAIESGDTLVSEDANTSVKLTYNENDTRYVCVVDGNAYILR